MACLGARLAGEQGHAFMWTTQSGERVSRETMCLLAICLLDTISSALLFRAGYAVEGNPLLQPYAQAGVLPFVVMKTALFLPALALLESFSRRRPTFIRPLMRWGAVLYAGLYAVGTAVQLIR
jgi:Domain of unknown function (DUF5658)